MTALPSMPAPPPGQMPAGDPTAVMGRRIGAYVIDVLIGWIVFAILVVALGDTVTSSFNGCGSDNAPAICFDTGDTIYFADDDTGGGIFLLTVGWWLAMGSIVQGVTGGTPGKLMVGLRVIDQRTGQLAGFGKSLGRTLLWVIDALPFFPLVGLITGVSTKGHRRVGDMAAKTFVVDKRSVGTPPMVPGFNMHNTPYVAAPPPDGYPPTGSYSPPPPGSTAPVAGAAPPPATWPTGADAPAARDPFAPPEVPVPDTEPPEPPPAATPTRAGIDAPMWDADRGAYIQWDKVHEVWMVYDDAEAKWKPLV